jgi:carbonic anhydrase/acetyltransferase-like protein (isoleucine patch superfamily)
MREPHIPRPTIAPTAVIAPGSHISGDVTIGPETFILFGVVARAELDRIEIGARTNIQDNSVLHCDEGVPCLIGDRVTVGHSAVVHGAVVEDDALIGIGAKALNRSKVGKGALLAAGSVLAEGKEVPPYTLAMGIPAKPVRELTEEEIARTVEGVEHYNALASAYREIFANLR